MIGGKEEQVESDENYEQVKSDGNEPQGYKAQGYKTEVFVGGATVKNDGFEVGDGEAVRAMYPETFFIPDAWNRMVVPVGVDVKLLFRFSVIEERGELVEVCERMWVTVTGSAGGVYKGELNNIPWANGDLFLGMEVYFQPCSIIDIASSDPEARDALHSKDSV